MSINIIDLQVCFTFPVHCLHADLLRTTNQLCVQFCSAYRVVQVCYAYAVLLCCVLNSAWKGEEHRAFQQILYNSKILHVLYMCVNIGSKYCGVQSARYPLHINPSFKKGIKDRHMECKCIFYTHKCNLPISIDRMKMLPIALAVNCGYVRVALRQQSMEDLKKTFFKNHCP